MGVSAHAVGEAGEVTLSDVNALVGYMDRMDELLSRVTGIGSPYTVEMASMTSLQRVAKAVDRRVLPFEYGFYVSYRGVRFEHVTLRGQRWGA